MFDWIKKVLFEEEEQVVDEAQLEDIDFTKVDTHVEHIIQDKPIQARTIEPTIESTIEKTASFGIDLEPKTVVKERKEEFQFHSEVRRDYKSDIVIPNVISPIYGGLKLEGKKKTVPSDALPKSKRMDGLGTIISPVYGQKELEGHRTTAVEKINNAVPVMESWEDDIPLDEFLQVEEENNECKQFSLFEEEVSQSIEEEL